MKRTDEQLDLMAWKMEDGDKDLVVPVDGQDMCIMNLLKSVSEVHTTDITLIIVKSLVYKLLTQCFVYNSNK